MLRYGEWTVWNVTETLSVKKVNNGGLRGLLLSFRLDDGDQVIFFPSYAIEEMMSWVLEERRKLVADPDKDDLLELTDAQPTAEYLAQREAVPNVLGIQGVARVRWGDDRGILMQFEVECSDIFDSDVLIYLALPELERHCFQVAQEYMSLRSLPGKDILERAIDALHDGHGWNG